MAQTTTFIGLTFKKMPQEVYAAGISARIAWVDSNPGFYKCVHRAGRWSDRAIAALARRVGAIEVEASTSSMRHGLLRSNDDRRKVNLSV